MIHKKVGIIYSFWAGSSSPTNSFEKILEEQDMGLAWAWAWSWKTFEGQWWVLQKKKKIVIFRIQRNSVFFYSLWAEVALGNAP